MSGKHTKATAWRVARGTPVLSVTIGLIAWVAIAAALVLLPDSSPDLLDGPSRESDRTAAGATAGPAPTGDTAGTDDTPLVDPTRTARERAGDDSSAETDRREDRTPSSTADPADQQSQEQDQSSPWADNPGRAEDHRKQGQPREPKR